MGFVRGWRRSAESIAEGLPTRPETGCGSPGGTIPRLELRDDHGFIGAAEFTV